MRSCSSRRSIGAIAVLMFCVAAYGEGPVERGPWVGAVTDSSAVIVAKLAEGVEGPRLQIVEASATGALARAPMQAPDAKQPADSAQIARFTVPDLKPNTQYMYSVRSVAKAHPRGWGWFTTFPIAGAEASFKFVFGSCAKTGSTHGVFHEIARQAPLFYLQTGDLHYEDIDRDRRSSFRTAYDSVLGSITQTYLYRRVPIVYTWDDHDFISSRTSDPGVRTAAHGAYREYVPHYPLASTGAEGPLSQAFAVGRVRFILLDVRSQRDNAKTPDSATKTMLGAWQKEWLKRELRAANRTYPLIFVVSPVSWISDQKDKGDNWGRYAHERAELSDWMVDHGIKGVSFLSGDAHMLAADDGTHNNYARNGGPGFPALQAAPLDHRGSVKGGPWSVTPVLPEEEEGQFGLVQVDDHGDSIEVLFRGLNHRGKEKLRFAFSVPASGVAVKIPPAKPEST